VCPNKKGQAYPEPPDSHAGSTALLIECYGHPPKQELVESRYKKSAKSIRLCFLAAGLVFLCLPLTGVAAEARSCSSAHIGHQTRHQRTQHTSSGCPPPPPHHHHQYTGRVPPESCSQQTTSQQTELLISFGTMYARTYT
jgi:hypothetical protein